MNTCNTLFNLQKHGTDILKFVTYVGTYMCCVFPIAMQNFTIYKRKNKLNKKLYTVIIEYINGVSRLLCTLFVQGTVFLISLVWLEGWTA